MPKVIKSPDSILEGGRYPQKPRRPCQFSLYNCFSSFLLGITQNLNNIGHYVAYCYRPHTTQWESYEYDNSSLASANIAAASTVIRAYQLLVYYIIIGFFLILAIFFCSTIIVFFLPTILVKFFCSTVIVCLPICDIFFV